MDTGDGGQLLIDEATAAAYNKLIAEQADATRHLAEVLKKDLRDIAVLKKERAALQQQQQGGQGYQGQQQGGAGHGRSYAGLY